MSSLNTDVTRRYRTKELDADHCRRQLHGHAPINSNLQHPPGNLTLYIHTGGWGILIRTFFSAKRNSCRGGFCLVFKSKELEVLRTEIISSL